MMSTRDVIAVFLAIMAYYYPELSDPFHMPKGISTADVQSQYDFIIVGAGAAGSVLGNRLSEIKDWKILLLESGLDETPISKTPLFLKIFRNRSLTWQYSTVKQENACLEYEGICDYPTGKVMGGSSSINGMLYARGSKHDYDEWENMGCTNWSYENVLPYFIKSESTQIPTLKKSKYHGRKGPLIVQHSKYLTPLTPDVIAAAGELGIPNRDYNGEYLTAADIPQITVNGAQRWSASSAYLVPVKDRTNLNIVKNALVHRVIIDAITKTAVGVEYESAGVMFRVGARKEVILSAGAINSPKVLMLSGIGPKEELKRLGIPVISDLPVGKNFHDHAQVRIVYELKGEYSIDRKQYSNASNMLLFAEQKNGIFSYNAFPAMIFFSLGNDISADPPDAQIHLIDFNFGPEAEDNSLISVLVNKAKPESRGSVTLKSKDPREPPLINPNYFSAKRDVQDTIAGLEKAKKLMRTRAMLHYDPEIFKDRHPHCKDLNKREFLECLVRYYSGTIYHPVGTTRMGPPGEATTVVDPELRVVGVKGLRVIDASIMPTIVRANTNGPVMMIAEKASDTIKRFYNES